jgi:hypothetical protein
MDSTASLLKNIASLVEAGGQVTLGVFPDVGKAAMASDGTKMLAMLRPRAGESILDLLTRLDEAIATAQSSGEAVDEINTTA